MTDTYQCPACEKQGGKEVIMGHISSCPGIDDVQAEQIMQNSDKIKTTMTENTSDSAPAQQIKDFEYLYCRQVAFNRYRVLNLKDSNTAYQVDLDRMTCSCGDSTYTEQGQPDVCKHLAYALFQAPQRRQAEEHTVRQMASITQELQSTVNRARDAAEQFDGALIAQRSAEANQAQMSVSDGTSGTTEDDTEDAGQVKEVDGYDDGEIDLQALEEWFEKAAQFNDFDPSIVDLKTVKADGEYAIEVNTAPWLGDDPYYDDGEWVNKDAFDAEDEKLKDTVLSPRDEFEWYGEPDYSWVIAREDVHEVIE